MNRLKPSQIKINLNNLIASYCEDPALLFNIPITHSKNGAMPSNDYLQKEVGATREQLRKYSDLVESIRLLMVEHDVILLGENASALEVRREMRNWWSGLSLTDKNELDIFGNSIQFNKYFPKFRRAKQYEIVSTLATQFNQELLELDILDRNYVIVKDRGSNQGYLRSKSANKKRDRWKYLGALSLESVDDLVAITEQTEIYIQVQQLFAVMLTTQQSDSSVSNYKIAHKHFVDYLIQCSVPSTSHLSEILEEFILSRFMKDYILPQIHSEKMRPLSANTIISCMRKTLERATKIKGLGFTAFYDVEGFSDAVRSTDMYKPYSLQEREQINQAIVSDLTHTQKLMKPYAPSNVGEYPLTENHKIIPKLGTLENARFLFENYLDCKPVFYGSSTSVYGDAFLRIVRSNGIELHKLYESWGVIPAIDTALIAPFIFRLAQITGMNSDSICALELDDYLPEHQITSKPCITYWKERSNGGKAYHLDIFKAELQWLTTSQSKAVKEVFDTVIKLTEQIRKDAPEEVSKRLFIIKSTSNASFGKVMAINTLVHYFASYVTKHEMKNDAGEPMRLNIARFRPTFVSDLIEKDVSIREIQLMLGHKYLSTTMRYLDRLDFSRIARDKVKAALSKIQTAAITSESKKKTSQTHIKNEEQIIFTTPLGGCANIFDPPQFIKNSSTYVKGQACAQYNKCLGCENVMLISSHLPELFAMRRDYLLLLQNSKILHTPYGVVISENLSLLEEILTPCSDGFSKEELDIGEQRSLFVETNIIDSAGA